MALVRRILRWSQDSHPLAYTSLSVKETTNMMEYHSHTHITVYSKRNVSDVIKNPNQFILTNQKGDDLGRPDNSGESVKETGGIGKHLPAGCEEADTRVVNCYAVERAKCHGRGVASRR